MKRSGNENGPRDPIDKYEHKLQHKTSLNKVNPSTLVQYYYVMAKIKEGNGSDNYAKAKTFSFL